MHTDPLWMKSLLTIHIAAGTLCLLMAPLALLFVKGGRRHRRCGRIYFWSMAMVATTALPMALFRPVLFLAPIAVLSFYLAFSGYRALGLKDLARGGSAGVRDWTMAVAALTACTGLVALAILRPAIVQNMGIIAIVLGAVGIRAAVSDLYRFWNKPTDTHFWVFIHFERFIASYIAVLTAFSTVTLSQILPQAVLVVWLWPLTIGIPAIFLATFYYRRRYQASEAETSTA